ncbi:MAG: hypothetical protein EXX96DRAFT_567022 [Benjaminiella poitrasii]|nr:MAG: hypothetical protein EXX96DRAFT_567022 [Benjaminiella poitrasii]
MNADNYLANQMFSSRTANDNALNKSHITGKSLGVLIRQLDYTLNMGPSERAKHNQQSDEEFVEFCIHTIRNYENNVYAERDYKTVQTCNILLKFLQATLKYENNEYDATLEYIKSTFVFPFDGDYTNICKHAEQYEQLEDDVCSHVPDMIVITIETLYALWKQYSDPNLANVLNEDYRKHLIQTYEKYINSVMVFVGLISSKIPTTVLKKINR